MDLLSIIIIAIGLAMDCFAVSIAKGMAVRKFYPKYALRTAFLFGLFQGFMPLIGYLAGISFAKTIAIIDHWIAFILLALIGLSMIKESREEGEGDDSYDFKTMIVLAIATSIDALAVGISFALLNVDIFTSAALIGVITFILSAIGVKAGCRLGSRSRRGACLVGGIILILIGLKILLEHLGLISF